MVLFLVLVLLVQPAANQPQEVEELVLLQQVTVVLEELTGVTMVTQVRTELRVAALVALVATL